MNDHERRLAKLQAARFLQPEPPKITRKPRQTAPKLTNLPCGIFQQGYRFRFGVRLADGTRRSVSFDTLEEAIAAKALIPPYTKKRP